MIFCACWTSVKIAQASLESSVQVQCCFTSTETVRTIGDGHAQDGHLDFHTATELCWQFVQSCFTSTETVGLLGSGDQDGHLDFHTAPERWRAPKWTVVRRVSSGWWPTSELTCPQSAGYVSAWRSVETEELCGSNLSEAGLDAGTEIIPARVWFMDCRD